MKQKILFIFILAGMLLTACAGGTQTFQTTTGLKLTTDGTWKELSGDDARALLDSEDASIDAMVLALQKKNKEDGSMTIERYDAGPILERYESFLTDVQEEAKVDWDGTIEWLRENEYTPREIKLMTPRLRDEAIDDDEQNYLMQELFEQDWIYQLTSDESLPSFQLVGVEDEEISGRRVQVFHFRYKNAVGVLLDQYDAVIVKGSSVYQIIQWVSSDKAEQQKNEFKEIRSSLSLPD